MVRNLTKEQVLMRVVGGLPLVARRHSHVLANRFLSVEFIPIEIFNKRVFTTEASEICFHCFPALYLYDSLNPSCKFLLCIFFSFGGRLHSVLTLEYSSVSSPTSALLGKTFIFRRSQKHLKRTGPFTQCIYA